MPDRSRWWDDGGEVAEEEALSAPPPAAPPPSPAATRPRPTREQLVEYRGALQRKLMLMRPRSPDRAGVEKTLRRVTADLMRLELESGRRR